VTPPLIIRKNSEFRKYYQDLAEDSLVSCILNLKQSEENIFVDLIERGINLFPSATSQLATRSKCFSAVIFKKWMLPNTLVIRCKKDLIKAIQLFEQQGIQQVITKFDRSDCGLGICKWQSIEELFSHISFSEFESWPFVLQPFVHDALDIRVVWLGEHYFEAYFRKNENSFRNNMHFGAKSGSYTLADNEKALCFNVMKRGNFPWAHIDLLKLSNGECFLSEISLFGGLKGAKIDQKTCNKLKLRIQMEFEKAFMKKENYTDVI